MRHTSTDPTQEAPSSSGKSPPDRYVIMHSPVGEVMVAHNGSGISCVGTASAGFVERFSSTFGRSLEPGALPEAWVPLVAAALESGSPGDLLLDLRRCSPFQRKVLSTTVEIPRGQVRTYAQLAQAIDHPRAFRAVGTALATNPVPLIIPCHRVVLSNGGVGAYSLGGGAVKAALLTLEKAVAVSL